MKKVIILIAALALMGASTMTAGTNGGIFVHPSEGGPHYIEIACADYHKDTGESQSCVTSDKTTHYRITPVGYKCTWDGYVWTAIFHVSHNKALVLNEILHTYRDIHRG